MVQSAEISGHFFDLPGGFQGNLRNFPTMSR